MDELKDLAKELLPTTVSRWVAIITMTLAAPSLFLFEFLQGLGWQVQSLSLISTRLLTMATILFLGSFVLNILLIFHINGNKLQLNNIRTSVINAINYIYSVNGDAIPSILFNELKEHYGLSNLELREFNTMLVSMFNDKLIIWEDAPNMTGNKVIKIIKNDTNYPLLDAQGDASPLSRLAPLSSASLKPGQHRYSINAVGDVVNVTEANTRKSPRRDF